MSRVAALLPLAAACHDPYTSTHPSPSILDLASDSRDARSDYPTEFASAPSPSAAAATLPCPSGKRNLGNGLTAERRPLDATPALDLEPCFDVVRADGKAYHFDLLTKAHDGTSQPATGWRERFRLTAVTNAGMFHASGKPVGMLVDDGVALSKDHPQFGGYLAFGPRDPSDPAITITGRDCAGFDLAALQRRYASILQANRLLGCSGEALPWKDPKQYSASAVGVDRDGNPVFVHARAAVTMTELARAVATLDLAGALFLEGGPEASLVVRGTDGEMSRVGSYETGFVENDENKTFWWLPNVLALEPN